MSASLRRRLKLDVPLALAAAGVGAATVVTGPSPDRPALQWVLVQAAALALVLVRYAPLAALLTELALVITIDVTMPGASHVAPLAAAVALGAVSLRHGERITAASYLATLTAVLVSIGRDPDHPLEGADGVVLVLSTALAVAAPVAFGCYLAAVRRAAGVAEARAREAEEHRVAGTRAARMAERARLAGDLHDLVAHHVSAIALNAGSARYAATHAPDPHDRLDAALAGLDSIQSSARQALVDLRGLLRILRDPDSPDSVTDPERMITEAVERSRRAGLRVTLTHDEQAARVPLALRITAARVMQEALTNALKHAGAGSDVAATVAVSGDRLVIDVANTLRLPPTTSLPPSGHGLTGMRERVEVLGGTLAAGRSGDGWRLNVLLPLEGRS
ncbi:sensor histidine kinase [Streptomyces sp. NPDC089424]|uniref:sensor histidine kinase n=1 Tax=Streptomyces sp. NPDC089424 TaxID=3365917 RepID=UPI00381A317B